MTKWPRWVLRLLRNAVGRICIPLDVPTAEAAQTLAARMRRAGARFVKVGLEMIMNPADAAKLIAYLREYGFLVFWDCKLCDIPNTVAGAVRNATRLGVQMINVHATGGIKMMTYAIEAARQEAQELHIERPLIIAVTVLTSLDFEDLILISPFAPSDRMFTQAEKDQLLQDYVVRLALLAKKAGLDGVVCSAIHAAAVHEACGDDFLTVTPGIRFADGAIHDQSQVATPELAAANGSDFFVIGRALTAAPNKRRAVRRAVGEIAAGLAKRARSAA